MTSSYLLVHVSIHVVQYVMLQVQSSCPVQELHTKVVLMGENCLIAVLILEGLATNLHTIVELFGYCRP